MAQLRFTLNVQRSEGKALVEPRTISGVYCETHNQITFAWQSEGAPAARPLHNSMVALNPNGVMISGFEREDDTFHYQEWWLVPAGTTAEATPPPLAPAREVVAAAPEGTEATDTEAADLAAAEDDGDGDGDTDGDGPLVWKPSLETGIEAVDNDHRILVDLINQVQAARRGGSTEAVVGSVLDSLIEYTDYHFAREERVQEAVGYEGLAAHHELHDSLRRAAVDFQERYKADAGSVDIDELYAFLRRWLVEHIMKEDMAFRDLAMDHAEAADQAAAGLSFVTHAGTATDDEMSDDELFFSGEMEDDGEPAPDGETPEEGPRPTEPVEDAPDAGATGAVPADPALEPLAASLPTDEDGSLRFTSELSVGNRAIDDDHQLLVDLINQVQEARTSANPTPILGSVLASLLEYTDYHFAREERIMEAVEFPEIDPHRGIHEQLRDTAVDYHRRFEADPDSVNLDEFDAFLKRWLVDHILREDMAYKPWVKDNPKADAAAASYGFLDYAGSEDMPDDDLLLLDDDEGSVEDAMDQVGAQVSAAAGDEGEAEEDYLVFPDDDSETETGDELGLLDDEDEGAGQDQEQGEGEGEGAGADDDDVAAALAAAEEPEPVSEDDLEVSDTLDFDDEIVGAEDDDEVDPADDEIFADSESVFDLLDDPDDESAPALEPSESSESIDTLDDDEDER